MTVATELIPAYYHQSVSGVAFSAVGNCRSRPVVVELPELLKLLPDVARMRVLGTAENAEFILRCRRARPDIFLEIGGPGLCLYAGELRHPDIVIQRMRQALLSSSLGGFHRCAYPDLAAYRLVRLARPDGQSDWSDRVREALRAHPAWYDLTFLPTLFGPAVAMLLATLIDPRWFVDLKRPDRLNRVKSFLGLTPAIQRRISHGDTSDSIAKRCAMVRMCWAGIHQQGDPDIAAPGNFLWRVRDVAADPIIGDLRASQMFINYLIRTWQHRIAKETMPWLKEPLFVPERLLQRGDVDEVAAYKEHARRRRDGPPDFGSE